MFLTLIFKGCPICWWLPCIWAEPTTPQSTQMSALWAPVLAEYDPRSHGELCIQQNPFGRRRKHRRIRLWLLQGLCDLTVLFLSCHVLYVWWFMFQCIGNFPFIQEACHMLNLENKVFVILTTKKHYFLCIPQILVGYSFIITPQKLLIKIVSWTYVLLIIEFSDLQIFLWISSYFSFYF